MVLAILATLAGLVLPQLVETASDARRDTALVTLAHLRDAITGTPGNPGFHGDLGEVPNTLTDLVVLPATLPSGALVTMYEPFAHRGWNGPYVERPTGTYVLAPAQGFTLDYGTPGAAGFQDPWGRPVVLQWPTTPGLSFAVREAYVRLVSAGPDGVIDTGPEAQAPDRNDPGDVGDDVVVYLFRANGP